MDMKLLGFWTLCAYTVYASIMLEGTIEDLVQMGHDYF